MGAMTKFDISNNPTIINKYDDGSGEECSEGITALVKAFKFNTSIVELNVAGLVGEHSNAGPKVAAHIADAIKDMGALSSFTFGDKQAVTMTTEMTDANYSGKLEPHEAQIVAAFLPKCT
jgi:hypothetical protein